MESVTVILLAGGKGLRMGLDKPKQYFDFQGKPLIHYSLDTLSSLPFVKEIIVVCDPDYQKLFSNQNFKFALPGPMRQNSLENGLKQSSNSDFICVHDAARPFIQTDDIIRLYEAAKNYYAATLATKIVYTVKEADPENLVLRTIPRENLWEIHTPQMIERKLLEKAMEHAITNQISVSDDVSLVEELNLPVKIVPVQKRILKVTTPEDLKALHYYYG